MLRSTHAAGSVAQHLDAIYAPFRVQDASIAPDGRRAAFILAAARGGIEVQVVDLENASARKTFPLDEDPLASPALLAWSTADRVIAASARGAILGIDVSAGLSQHFQENLSSHSAERTSLPAKTREAAGVRAGAGRSVRVLGIASGDPDAVLIEAVGSTPTAAPKTILLEVYRLNLRTGERTRIFERASPTPGGSVILDRQGTPRLVFNRDALVRRFDYQSSEATGEWRDLDQILTDRETFSFAVTPENFRDARTIPLGFDTNPNLLFFASNLGRATHGIYAVDLRTGKVIPSAVEDPNVDLATAEMSWTQSPLVFDRRLGRLVGIRREGLEPMTRWIDPEIAGVHDVVTAKFPGKNVQVLNWDDARARFIVLVGSPGDPGRYFVFHRRTDHCVEYFRRAPGLDAGHRNETTPFSFLTPAGVSLSGMLTWPRAPTVANPALVVWLRDPFDHGPSEHFDRDAQAVAAMGFAVAQLNYRGSHGFGRRQLEELRHNLDQAPVADVLAALEWLAARHRFDRRRVAIVGEGFGGYVALRALQTQPATFRCGAAWDAVLDLEEWRKIPFNISPELAAKMKEEFMKSKAVPQEVKDALIAGDELAAQFRAPSPFFIEPTSKRFGFDEEHLRWFVSVPQDLRKLAVTEHVELLTKPVLLLRDRDRQRVSAARILQLRDRLLRRKISVAYEEFEGAAAGSRPRTIRKLGEFLTAHAYDFNVRIGPATVKE